jgi:hypothetical protein
VNDLVKRKLKEWKQSPLLFVKECIQANPSDQQADALVRFMGSKRNSARSGHGVGKDALAAWLIIWFETTRPYAKVVCTAPTSRQLFDILWSELSKWLRQSLVADEFVIQKDKMFQIDAPKEWWARAVTTSVKNTKEEQAEALAGFHGDHLLIIVDEASGMPDPVFLPVEGALTQEDNWVFLIGNMTKDKGYFYDTHFHPEISKSWQKFHWDSRNSTNVKKEYVEYMQTKYGVDSNVFRIRVAGEPPLANEKTLIPLAWAIQCIGNDVLESIAEDEPTYLGVDVARYGEDASVILPRKSLLIHPWEQYRGLNTIDFANRITVVNDDFESSGIGIDEIGVGAGVVDYLEKKRVPGVFGINVASASSDITKYHRLRDELWVRVREKCMRAMYSFPDVKRPGEVVSLGHELANELSIPSYEFNGEGGFIVDSKKKLKMQGYPSPNIADALCLSEYFSDVSTRIWGNKKPKKKKRFFGGRGFTGNGGSSRSWMAN